MDDAEAETTKAADRPMELKIGMWPPSASCQCKISFIGFIQFMSKWQNDFFGGKHQQK